MAKLDHLLHDDPQLKNVDTNKLAADSLAGLCKTMESLKIWHSLEYNLQKLLNKQRTLYTEMNSSIADTHGMLGYTYWKLGKYLSCLHKSIFAITFEFN